MKSFRPLILFSVLLLIIGLACNAATRMLTVPSESSAESPSAPGDPSNSSTSSSMYFTEEFNQDPGWNYFLANGNPDEITVKFEDGLMKFDLENVEVNAYYLYEGQTYDDVRINMRAENLGKNNNDISLVCRASDAGWYEFSTEGGGLWYLYAITLNEKQKPVYHRMDNGGVNSLKQGKAVNDFGMICKGNQITMIVNDKEIKTVTDTKYDLGGGHVGFNISSIKAIPIIVSVDWFKVSEP